MFSDTLKGVDLYGSSIGFRFQGQSSYKTTCGGICSVITLIFLLLCFILKSIDFFGRLDPLYSMIENLQDENSQFDLFEKGYVFAIQEIDERYGRIKVEKVQQTLVDGERVENRTEIKMAECAKLIEFARFENMTSPVNLDSFNSEYEDKKFLCPVIDSMIVGGNSHTDRFDFI